MTFFDNMAGWQKLALLLVVLLVGTKIFAPGVADWALEGIERMARYFGELARDIGGTQ